MKCHVLELRIGMNINDHRSCFAALAASAALKKVCDDHLNSFMNYFNF